MRIKVDAIDQKTLILLQDTAPQGVTVKLGGMMHEGKDPPVAAIITFTPGSAGDAIGTWLYEKIKDKPAKVSVNRIRVALKQDEITQLIQQEAAKE